MLCGPIVSAQKVPESADTFTGKPRIAIVTDIGNEPDDQMSLVRLLLYSNELDIEAMVAATSTWQRTQLHPETIRMLVHAYGGVRSNLMLHQPGWPTEDDLEGRVTPGQPAYGMAATGPGKQTAGSKALLESITRADDRPLWICLWGGANTLAQALIDLRKLVGKQRATEMLQRVRISSISDQDDAGPWIRKEFPGLFYVVTPSQPDGKSYYMATWTGISGDKYYRNSKGADTSLVTNEWLDQNIRSKGSLGKAYPRFLFIMEGDTPSFLNLVANGLESYRRPDWGGWGGRYLYMTPYGETHPIWTQGGDQFTRATSQDEVRGLDGQTYVSDQATVWRWRQAYQNDFAARMDWTIKDFAHANHAPVVIVNGSGGTSAVQLAASEGDTLELDANGTNDPDKGQSVTYSWFYYPEAGHDASPAVDLTIESDGPTATVHVRGLCGAVWLPGLMHCKGPVDAHIILAVSDSGSPQMTSYRRIILRVSTK
jgi:hypothetical protein